MNDKQVLSGKIRELTGWRIPPHRIKIITDTTEWMDIYKGCIIRLNGDDYLVRGNMRESRFGIDDQPKYWVFSAIEMQTGKEKILKTVFNEEFYVHIALFKIRCYRNCNKESQVIDTVRNDYRFMQGETCFDEKGNNVRVIDYIRGRTFFQAIPAIPKNHYEYFTEDLPEILHKLQHSFFGIKKLHDFGLTHGDIRNDHLIIDAATGNYRWIDFDLKEDVSDFDIWSIGNIIAYAVAKGLASYDSILKNDAYPESIRSTLSPADSSAFYTYRLMNLKKIYPYIPESLSNILLHFTTKPIAFYTSLDMLLDDYTEMLERDFKLKN
ncbi:MAG: hypothetical protein HW421_3084 [Ignavibacteria bacterium]|nr:hypothetical protein [Ignavibacteria bacterium]